MSSGFRDGVIRLVVDDVGVVWVVLGSVGDGRETK